VAALIGGWAQFQIEDEPSARLRYAVNSGK
jgi:hypothetical protein